MFEDLYVVMVGVCLTKPNYSLFIFIMKTGVIVCDSSFLFVMRALNHEFPNVLIEGF